MLSFAELLQIALAVLFALLIHDALVVGLGGLRATRAREPAPDPARRIVSQLRPVVVETIQRDYTVCRQPASPDRSPSPELRLVRTRPTRISHRVS
jgi:hypothetical protein